MVEAIRACLPPLDSRRYYHDRRVAEATTYRWMRLAVYLNDEAGYNHQGILSDQIGNTTPSVIVGAFARLEVGIPWLTSRTPAFQIVIVAAKAELLIDSGFAASDFGEVMEYCRAACRRDPALAPLYPRVAEYDLFQGRLGRLAELLAAPAPDQAEDTVPAFSAARALLLGDAARAVELFAEALRLNRKASRKRKGQLAGYHGLFHFAARIAADDARFHAEIDAEMTAKEQPIGNFAIRALLELARNCEPAAREAIGYALTVLPMLRNASPFSVALVAVAAVAIDPALVKKEVLRLAALYRQVEHTLPLVADMLAEVLERVADNPAPYRAALARPDREVRLRFTGLIAAREPWERALDSIEALLNPAKPVSVATVAKRQADGHKWIRRIGLRQKNISNTGTTPGASGAAAGGDEIGERWDGIGNGGAEPGAEVVPE